MDEEHIKRFWSKVDRNGPVVRPELGSCWIWTASTRNNYGAFSVNRKIKQAHRLSYELEYGSAPVLLRHKCDNRGCVRPTHLEPGTNEENRQDWLQRDPRFSVWEDVVAEARRLAAQGISIHKIEEQTGMQKNKLLLAIQGKTYQHVTQAPVALKDIYRPIFSKLTEEQYDEICAELKKPYRGQGRALATKYGVDPSMITLIKQGKVKSVALPIDINTQ